MKRFIMIIMFLLGSFAVGQNTNVYVPLTNTIEQNAVYYTPEPVYYAEKGHGVCPSGCIEGECSCWKWTGNHWTHNG